MVVLGGEVGSYERCIPEEPEVFRVRLRHPSLSSELGTPKPVSGLSLSHFQYKNLRNYSSCALFARKRTASCRVWGVGCGAWGVGCGMWGVGCGVWSVECGVLGAVCSV